ncbi:MAG: hypothetical protein KR126chlam2_01179 [Chlamydiae bacterium]|nr:hypothetical protein [Chlamydiota bacterium]
MSAAAYVSNFSKKSIPHIVGSTTYVTVPGVSFTIGAARTAYAVRNLFHHHKIQKYLGDILSVVDAGEDRDGRHEGARECLSVTMAQKQQILDRLRSFGKYSEDQLTLPLNAACVGAAHAASGRMTAILWRELARGLSEIFLPFVGPLLWTLRDFAGATSESGNLFGCDQFLESWKWNDSLYPLAKAIEHPKEF